MHSLQSRENKIFSKTFYKDSRHSSRFFLLPTFCRDKCMSLGLGLDQGCWLGGPFFLQKQFTFTCSKPNHGSLLPYGFLFWSIPPPPTVLVINNTTESVPRKGNIFSIFVDCPQMWGAIHFFFFSVRYFL